ncbi:cytidylyltransferase domain-containing protein [Paracnuella aquatica]|uniref:acylneuraminate cytidylyltransferase family protein n=1 Tax=Paracnuella aquatica TaxID=2268757 RepID=UPI000DEEFCEC|nr:acylneuraminate cytidylyltransferase family protein [Paracnuella aquatica]RPD45524.1 acylneuraminate cytidylyltransferase family protein [Paracnuella aquatica]
MRILYVIPARGGSKGIPGKNIKKLGGTPLINYTVEVARSLAADRDICVSTDDVAIKEVVEQTGLFVPFLRPSELATDQSGTYEVLIHVLDYYEQQGEVYDLLVLLQPTSPFRTAAQVREAIATWKPGIEMIVSVKISSANPYYTLTEENKNGFLERSKPSSFVRRQDCPIIYEYNGAIYVMDVQSLRNKSMHAFDKIKKYVMDDYTSVDIDSKLDWEFAEFLLNKKGQ